MPARANVLATGLFVSALAWAVVHGQAQSPQKSPVSPGVAVVGTVVDTALAPVLGVTVTLERDGRPVARATTDAEGRFRVEFVLPGEYRVRAELAGFTPFSRSLTVRTTSRMVQLPLVIERIGVAEAAKAVERSARIESRTRDGIVGGVVGGVVGGLPSSPPPPPAPGPPVPPASPVRVGGVANGGGGRGGSAGQGGTMDFPALAGRRPPYETGEDYAHVPRNRFQLTSERPVSTFGADVDTASYSNVRRFLSQGQLPPVDAVRVEELVNYFHFNYAEPRGSRPLALTTEVGECPWAPAHKLVLIGARAKAPENREIEGRNIVLLVDVSGSMAPPERLPMIKSALGMFVDTLRPDDRLAIVTYAGTSGIALPSTPARQRGTIHDAIERLNAGGSTNGGQGLILAYRTARQSYIPGGVNRVILATDGDFNVGIVNQFDLLKLIEREKDSGVFLSVFGVGTGNLKDARMEMLADRGNGHYAYLDSIQEARRVLIREADATLETVAKDVKFQVEFNPASVTAWRLIGYENRALARQDFNDDRNDGGEMGAGHTVTVLYEVVPAGTALPEGARSGDDRPIVDPLKYQSPPHVEETPAPRPATRPVTQSAFAGELLTVKVRYKLPEAIDSDLIEQAVKPGARASNLPFASAVAEFGLLLRDGRAPAARWDGLTRRLKTITAPPTSAADRESFADLVDLAAGLHRLRHDTDDRRNR
jgi:Ca-activated chloride channel family protein